MQDETNTAISASTAMQEACRTLYAQLATVDILAKQVQELRHSVEQLETRLNAKLQPGHSA